MTDNFVGEIRIFGFEFAPRNWAYCRGQLLSIQQNTALFAILGTNFGGNGTNNFALPNLQGYAPMQPGQGPALSSYVIGQRGGSPNVTLLQQQMPSHSHAVRVAALNGATSDPTGRVPARSVGASAYSPGLGTGPQLGTLPLQGGNQPHNNMMPYMAMNYCIALLGTFPSRN